MVHALRPDPGVEPPGREVVHGRRAQHRVQLRGQARGARAGRQGGLPLDRRARRHPHAHLCGPDARELQGGQRPPRARRPQGRPCRDLHADDPRAADRDAGLRPDRRAAHGGLRRVQCGVAVGPHQRLRRQGADHGRRRLAPGQEGGPQAPRGRGGRGDAHDRARDRRGPLRRRRAHGPAPRLLVARHRGPPGRGLPARPRGQRAHALPALHVRHDGEAQGDPAHLRGLSPGRCLHALGRVRHQARRRLLVRRGHRLGHRAQLHRVRPPRQRHDRGSSTRAPRTRRRGTAGGRSSSSTRSASCTAPRPPSGPS